MASSAEPHGFVTKGIHWVSAALLGYGYLKGLETLSQLDHPALLRTEVAFAGLLGVLFLFRLFWTKRIAGATRLPLDAPIWEHLASRAVHIGLYASVFLIVLSGLGIALGVTTFAPGGMFVAAMIGLHELSLTVLPLLILAHVAGALWHKVVRRDGVLESMTGKFPT